MDELIDVVVVGAGPSGLMTAMELALAGVEVTIVEKRDGPTLSRAGVLQPRVMEIFAMRGLADRVLARAQEVNGHRYRSSGGMWAGIRGVDYGLLDTDFPYTVILSQMEVEKLLTERCEELGVRFLRRVEITHVEELDHAVALTGRRDREEIQLEARYAVGADGARSAVRTSLGIPWQGTKARNLAVNVDAEIPFPFEAASIALDNENGWGLAYPLAENVSRLAVIDAQTMIDTGNDLVIDRETAFDAVERVFGRDVRGADAMITQFHDALMRAGSMRQGRVFLVGESVRIHYPAAGVGMNFCLQDAFNLGWKLAAAVQGWGGEHLLDSYERERSPEMDALLAGVQAQTFIQFAFSPEALALKAFLRNLLLPLPEVQRLIGNRHSGLSADYGGEGLVGLRVPNGKLSDGTSLYGSMRADAFAVAASAKLPLKGLVSGPHLDLLTLGEDIPGGEGKVLLIRPDGHVAVAGTAESVAEAARQAGVL